MIDLKDLRENPGRYRTAAKQKRIDVDIDRLLALESERRSLDAKRQQITAEKNAIGKQIGQLAGKLKSAPADQKAALQEEMKKLQARPTELKSAEQELDARVSALDPAIQEILLRVPQPPDSDVPVGKDDTENVEIRKWGTVRQFDFEPKSHIELGETLALVDFERGVKLAGTRSYVLRGAGSLLHNAVLRLALDLMIERGFEPMTVPVLVREPAMVGTGYFPLGREQSYEMSNEDPPKYLVGTAEVALTAFHMDEILDAAALPKKYVAMSPCFRREAGAAGKDTAGLYRIHQFDKVEQVIVCRNDIDESKRWHEAILKNAEDVLQKLNLPYRVVYVCTGDLGQGQVAKYDIETWMLSRGGYGETHSASRFYDFQARRLNMRYRDADGKVKFCHTLNNTVIASPRILIPILELYQNADGSVTIPDALAVHERARTDPKDRLMLKSQLLHPQILHALARAGHGAKVLVSDGNYPHWPKHGPNAEVVFLNLSPGQVLVTDVLRALLSAIPIEKAEVMDYARSGPNSLPGDPPIWKEFGQLLHEAANDLELEKIERFKFYDAAGTRDVCLTVATGDQRIYANLLLTIGVVKPPKS